MSEAALQQIYNIQIGGGGAVGNNGCSSDKKEVKEKEAPPPPPPPPPLASWKRTLVNILRVFNVCSGLLLLIGQGCMEAYALKQDKLFPWYFRFLFRLLLMILIIVIMATNILKPDFIHKAFPQYGHTKSWVALSLTQITVVIAIYSDPLLGIMQDRQGDSRLVHIVYPGVISVNAIMGFTGIAYFIVSVTGGVKLKCEYYKIES